MKHVQTFQMFNGKGNASAVVDICFVEGAHLSPMLLTAQSKQNIVFTYKCQTSLLINVKHLRLIFVKRVPPMVVPILHPSLSLYVSLFHCIFQVFYVLQKVS